MESFYYLIVMFLLTDANRDVPDRTCNTTTVHSYIENPLTKLEITGASDCSSSGIMELSIKCFFLKSRRSPSSSSDTRTNNNRMRVRSFWDN